MIYFIQEGEDGPIKIGSASDPQVRLGDLQVGNPTELRIVATRAGDARFERYLHRRFVLGRLRGEWFSADTPGLRDYMLPLQIERANRRAVGYQLCGGCGEERLRRGRRKYCDACAEERGIAYIVPGEPYDFPHWLDDMETAGIEPARHSRRSDVDHFNQIGWAA